MGVDFHLYYSNTGKRLMAKCRLLYQENEELGKMIASGRLAKLESDLALQRNLTEEMKKSQSGSLDSLFVSINGENSIFLYLISCIIFYVHIS